MKKLIRQSNQLILHKTHIRLPATKAAPSVAMVGDLSLAKVDSKANPYTNKATEKKSHAFIGNKRLEQLFSQYLAHQTFSRSIHPIFVE